MASRAAWLLGAFMLAGASAAAADKPDTLARARAYYNQRQFDAAVTAAEQARLFAAAADAADLIGARAYLERFRESGSADDLGNARARLRRLDPQRLDARERAEYVVGLGEALYFDGAFGAAADLFDSILSRDGLGPEARERTLEWWASSVDEDAKPRPDIERQPMYQRIRDRMQRELGTNPASGSAAYWLSAAARAQGNLQAAWDAALAAWVRAPLAADHGAALRGDIDRLVLTAIVPERARMIAQTPDTVKAEWDQFKDRWNK